MEQMEKVRGLMKNLLNNQKLGEAFFALFDRWEDEKMYEDWKDYANAMKKLVSENCDQVLTNFKATKRPFGIKFDYEGYKMHLYIQIQGSYAYFRVKSSLIK